MINPLRNSILLFRRGFLCHIIFFIYSLIFAINLSAFSSCSSTSSLEIIQKLQNFRPIHAVYGNIDGSDIRCTCPEIDRFTIEGVDVLMKHIGGYPGNYDASIRAKLFIRPPRLFISGHSHILKVKFDKTLNLLHINPGAAGKYGWHKTRTLVRFTIDKGEFKDLEVIELSE